MAAAARVGGLRSRRSLRRSRDHADDDARAVRRTDGRCDRRVAMRSVVGRAIVRLRRIGVHPARTAAGRSRHDLRDVLEEHEMRGSNQGVQRPSSDLRHRHDDRANLDDRPVGRRSRVCHAPTERRRRANRPDCNEDHDVAGRLVRRAVRRRLLCAARERLPGAALSAWVDTAFALSRPARRRRSRRLPLPLPECVRSAHRTVRIAKRKPRPLSISSARRNGCA